MQKEPSEKLQGSHQRQQLLSWVIFVAGLMIWVSVQGYLVIGPLWMRSELPEVDDSLAYLVRTQVMDECISQDCPALVDLREQICLPSSDGEICRQREIAVFPFPFYHPLFSLILLWMKHWTQDLTTAYKVLWSVTPIVFGTAFAFLLTSLWGRTAAGLALGLLALKIFPGAGLQYLTPTNLSLALAVFMWARIISRRGDAPWTMAVGTVALVGIHPIGGVFALMSAVFAFLVSGAERNRRVWVAIFSTISILILTLLAVAVVKRVPVFNPLEYVGRFPGIIEMVKTFVRNSTEVLVQVVRIKAGLFGSLPLFFASLALGFWALARERRKPLAGIILIYCIILLASLVHSHSLTPRAALFFRLWIPLVVILFGAVGNALAYLISESLRLRKDGGGDLKGAAHSGIQRFWPVLALALIAGYLFDMSLSGSEHVFAIREHLRNRQDLRFDAGQTKLLLSKSRPGDRVLYTSSMIMASYFTNGAMELGAVYYHPAFVESSYVSKWLQRKDLRFAVAYNPAVYHPSLEGLDEKNRCVTGPEFYFSPLNDPRKHGPISREGFIPAADFKWIQLNVNTPAVPPTLKVYIRNPSKSTSVELVPVDGDDKPAPEYKVCGCVPGQWTGWLELDLGKALSFRRFRIKLPAGQARFWIGGVNFGTDKNYWPWTLKADLILEARDPATGTVLLRYDPAALLPAPVNKRKIRVLNDEGSSVLFSISG